MTVHPAPPTLQLMTSGTWISTEGYRPFKCESFTKALRFVICRLLALFGIYIYIFVVTDNSRLQPRPQAAFPWLLWKSALGTRLLWPRLTAMNVGAPKCVTKLRSRDTARSSVWVIVFQICRLLNCEERLPLLVFDSVFWGVSSTEVVLFPLNSSTRKKLRLLCVGVTFVISSSRYERTKTLGKFVILTNGVHKRRNENQSPLQNMLKEAVGCHFWWASEVY